SILGNLAFLTFTHVRPDATRLFRDGTVEPQSVVRARIVITVENLTALRDLLNRVIQAPDTPAPPAGGPTRPSRLSARVSYQHAGEREVHAARAGNVQPCPAGRFAYAV